MRVLGRELKLANPLTAAKPSPERLLEYYRYISLVVTAVTYLAAPFSGTLFLKLVVVACLIIEAVAAVRAYGMSTSDYLTRKNLIALELLGLSVILLFTGGIESPFLWYAMNPVLASVTLSPWWFCWAVTAGFLSMVGVSQAFILGYLPPVTELLHRITAYCLLVLGAQGYTYLIQRYSEQAEHLKEHVEHVRLLYEAMEVFTQRNDPEGVASLFASYGKSLTGATKVIVWLETNGETGEAEPERHFGVRGPRRVLEEHVWLPYIKKVFRSKEGLGETSVLRFVPADEEAGAGEGVLKTVWITSATKPFGLLSVYFPTPTDADDVDDTLLFLADLCALALERHKLERISREFILVEEKDRIAAEMHDSVAHDLFALVYGIDELLGEAKLSENGREKLLSLQSRARSAMKEVRQAIYQMSTLKSGKEPFVEEVGEYLESLGTLNDVAVDFDHDDRLHDMKAATRHALYRIIREATGNAVRHGQCDSINVALGVEENTISLRVEDDGTGFDPTAFDYRSDEERESGLGLINMKEQARALGGNLEIESSTGEGTTVTCVLPRTDNGRVRREASND